MLGALQLRLVYASNSMEDVLMKLHLDAMAAGYYGKFKVRPCVALCPVPCTHSRCNHTVGYHAHDLPAGLSANVQPSGRGCGGCLACIAHKEPE